jgi:hypothetical protein
MPAVLHGSAEPKVVHNDKLPFLLPKMDGGLIVLADQPQNLDGLGGHYFSHTRPRRSFRKPRSELPVFYASLTNNVEILVLLGDNSRSGALCGWLMLS